MQQSPPSFPPRRTLPAALLLLLASAGPALAAPPTDAAGKPIPVAAGAKRIVSIGGAVTEIIYALGAQSRIVAVDTTSQYPPAALKTHPNVGYLRALSAEGVLSIRPDLVLADFDAGPPTAIAQMRAAGARIVILRKALDAGGVVYKIRAVARALGLESRGETLARRYDADMARVQAAIAKLAGGGRPRVLFVLSIGRGAPLAAGRETSAASIIELAGGVNAISGYTGYKPLSPEAALASAPDVILVTTRTRNMMGGIDGLLTRPELKLTPAGRKRRVVAMDGLYLLGFGPRTARAVQTLARHLHPSLSVPILEDGPGIKAGAARK